MGTFGVWGFAAHDAAERASAGDPSRTARGVTLVVEWVAGVLAIVAMLAWMGLFLAFALGRMIS